MPKKKPVVTILRSATSDFVGAYPEEFNEYNVHPSENVYLKSSVASANDCTGIAVTIPKNESEAASLDEIRSHPASHK